MAYKILTIGIGDEGKSALYIASMKEKFGDDIILVTPEEAKEQGLRMEDFVNTPTITIEAPPIIKTTQEISLSGKEKRRERREKERKNNKNKF